MRRAGFTLVEAVVSTAIVTMAGSALLLGVASAIDATDTVLDQSLAEGMAQQLMDEIASRQYAEPGLGGHQTTLGPESEEWTGRSRAALDDLDDYHGLNVSPPRDPWGIPLGRDAGDGLRRISTHRYVEGFRSWRQHVQVFYASPADFTQPLGPGQTSDYRVVWVSIYRDQTGKTPELLAQLRRVFSYVPHN
jgi:type II secretory pathway pseudopilin PulG